jgi:hypothetical protein
VIQNRDCGIKRRVIFPHREYISNMSATPAVSKCVTGLARAQILFRFRCVLGFFLLALILSGITAFPLERELEAVTSARGLAQTAPSDVHNGLDVWILTVRDGLRETYVHYPWVAYGTDWLAFAHIVIAIFFIGAFIDPMRNVWTLKAGLIACALVVPLALVCGEIRHIPFAWRLIDCSFGVFGALPLIYCLKLTRAIQDIDARATHES